ncbi:glycolate dehydrogenase [Xanthomonas phage FoX5]|uniref:Glycolate dehydrogenase n=1 Tax=Xanthomonas phage FoX5 TaxID=2723901 RepID=A0A858NNY0_9CAUD|nr:glycolate dehydrogenase [Xanthomonas phage FoX5]QJB21980.1 glycolate dehydrogenase [Xanthomonas phage FoX5]
MERREAIALGLKRYTTGRPCKNGHVAERSVVDGNCRNCKCERDAAWASANREKKRRNVAKYRAANRDKAAAYYAANRERVAIYRAENADKARAYRAARYAANPEKAVAKVAAWRAANPDKKRALHTKRRAVKLAAIPADWSEFDAFVIEEAHAACKRRAELHGEPFHVDHMVPLTRGGLHCATNIQVIPARLNLRKGNRLWLTQPGEWIAHA